MIPGIPTILARVPKPLSLEPAILSTPTISLEIQGIKLSVSHISILKELCKVSDLQCQNYAFGDQE